ncbi:CLUMA_CG007462, isoform A [Clunio marinus]|uniref:Zinc phosphodiesterase ELAC protein 2 n=1 Tax=Clunio marinus TaxID=568069 RepID=A0A1J1I0Q8_9DIPT|nr:CLUMA_CG007462, isoform A [Clunio marinus]
MLSLVSCFRRYSKKSNLVKYLIEMPKDNTEHIELGQKQRIKIREKSKYYSPGIVNLQVLGNGANGGSSSIYLFSEQTRYLFNCGEGTQRLAHEHKTKLARMENIFLTRKTWDHFGGVSGLCLTLQDVGVPSLHLHGPAGIDRIFESSKKFVVLKNMNVVTPECNDGGFYEDSVMKVNYVPLKKVLKSEMTSERTGNEKTDMIFKDDTDYYGYENGIEGSSSNSSIEAKESFQVEADYEDTVMAYICKLQERPGALDIEKCVDRGVPPGPLLGQLKNGIDVELPNGLFVKARDVRAPAFPGSVFIFVDIPDESYLQSLIKCQRFKRHQKTAEKDDDRAVVVIHFSPPQMMENKLYKQWIDEFSASTLHLCVNEQNEFSGYFAAHRTQRQLNELDENVFPLLRERHPCLTNNEENFTKKMKIDEENDKFKYYHQLQILSTFHIRPAKGFDRSYEPCSNPEKVLEETILDEDSMKLISEFKEKIVKRSREERAKEFPKVITLGTGSCIPNKTRNVSANLVHISKDNCAILDCGEGTLGQLVRFYGQDGADDVLRKLSFIYISHLHADHHLGLINLLTRRRQVTSEKVLVIAPAQINMWLAFYNFRIEEIYSTFEVFPCSNLLAKRSHIEQDVKDELCNRLGLVDIKTCYVKHCPYSYGISFEMKNTLKNEHSEQETFKITYSGDTLPCDELVELGKNSDILIHEATMEDDLAKEARIKMHSTVSQAIDIGRQMNAKFVILTHFSQRYAKIPLLEKHDKNVAIAFDNMEVTLNDLPMMHLMYEPLKAMFSDHFRLLERKALKRKIRDEKKVEMNL